MWNHQSDWTGIKRLKSIGIDHMIIGYNFLTLGKDIDGRLEMTKHFLKFLK